MDQPLIVGQVGVGGFGHTRRNALREAGCFEIAAVCDRDADVLERAASEEDAEQYLDYTRMLERDDLEGVVISTGADSHAALAIQAMEAGKHVFVEKPLCTSVEQINQLRAAQRVTQVKVGMGHNHHDNDAAIRMFRKLEREGAFGTVACYEANSSHSGGLEIRAGDWRGKAEANPGGMLFQCGVHKLHMLVHLFGPIESVQAMMRYDAHPDTETADVANVLIRHESGVVGTLNCYHVTAYTHTFHVMGTAGNLYMDTLGCRARYQRRKRNEPEHAEPIDVPGPPEAAHLNNVRNWFDAIRHDREPDPSIEDGIRAVLPIFAAERAAASGERVCLHSLLAELETV